MLASDEDKFLDILLEIFYIHGPYRIEVSNTLQKRFLNFSGSHNAKSTFESHEHSVILFSNRKISDSSRETCLFRL